MAQGPSGLCKHVWETKCRTCGTDQKHWPQHRQLSARELLDHLVSKAEAQEKINGGYWGDIAEWLKCHSVMVAPPSTTTNR